MSGDTVFLVAVRAYPVETFVDAFRPRHDLVVGNARIKQLRSEGSFIVSFVVRPVACPVLYRVCQEKHLATRRCGHGLHRAIFEVGCLEHPFGGLPVEIVRFAGGPGPYLCNISVYAGKRCKACLRAYYLPLRIVYQRVCRDIAFHVHTFAPAVFLCICENLIEGSVVEVIFEFVGQICVSR